jgi:pimeloyl-ACP methyl ester carboxylesterase
MPYAQVGPVRLHYYERGDEAGTSETIVFVHGFQASARIWQAMQDLLPSTYHSIAVNNRGAGETDAPPEDDAFGCKPFADDIYALVTQLGLRRFTMVGHSMGGATAAQYAVDHPETLTALVLMDPADPDGWADASNIEETIARRMADRARAQQAGSAGDGIVPRDASGERRVWLEALAADMAAAPERRLRGSMRSMATIRLGERVRALSMPVLLVAGDQDRLIPLPRLLGTFAKLPLGSGLQIWHGVDHSPNVEIPEEATAVLRRFIEQTVPARLATAMR